MKERKKKKRKEKIDSPLYAVVTSCSTRRACSPVGQSTEYASWGQATICQIRPIGHVRCAVYSVFSGVGRVSHACGPGVGGSLTCIVGLSSKPPRLASEPMGRRNTSNGGGGTDFVPPDETYDFHRENDRMHNLFSRLFDHERVRLERKSLGRGWVVACTGCRVIARNRDDWRDKMIRRNLFFLSF